MTRQTTVGVGRDATRAESKLAEQIVQRILSYISPLRIILFGSAARGEMTEYSDLDVLVVVADGSNCRDIARQLYRQFRGFPYAKDILVVTEHDVETQAENPYLVIHTALVEGKQLYHAAG